MKIVVDTNVVISGVFFGGFPRRILESIVGDEIQACATAEIVNEYSKVIEEMINRRQGKLNKNILAPLISKLQFVEPETKIDICRDPDDNKFLGCAIDGRALYIVSGDKDLLVLERCDGIEVITAKKFCEKYLSDH